MKRVLVAFAVLVLLQVGALAAPTTPDPSANPVLASIQKTGSKLYYLGKRMGMDGWFIVKDGQVQMVYATTDNKGALIGAIFGENGENITAEQVNALVQSNKEVADMINSAQKEQLAITQAGAPAAAATVASNAGVPSAALSPGERLIHDLSVDSTVVVGNAAAPELLMVMDPHCPHCQATWKALREIVMRGSLHIRMIPIGTQGTDDERAAAVLLGVSDPLNVWDKYVLGDKTLLSGTPPAAAVAAVRANHVSIDNWHIKDTPYLVYRGKDGKVKVVIGEPSKVSVMLTDVGL